ncbi:MAG: hypothetical protein EOP58_11125 [Sphingomonadales bacterium]|nr:MAG: hypothetical protein EOP58_11125 [Sphingomonadales bacterium]
MPGMLSNIFDAGDASQDDGGSTQSYDSQENSLGGDLDLDATIHIKSETTATWENADGSEGGFSRTDEITLDVDVDGTLHAVTGFEQSEYDAG